MEQLNHLRDIIARQREALRLLEAECAVIENSDTARENAALKLELEKLRGGYEKAAAGQAALADENKALKNALYEQIYNEKIQLVNQRQQKLEVYFRSQVEGELNRLAAVEQGALSRIHDIIGRMQRHNIEVKDKFGARLEELSQLLNQEVAQARQLAAGASPAFSQAELAELEALKKEQITDEQILAITKKNNVERFIGLNLLNGAGIFLIIIGIITASRYAYGWLPDTLKGILMFVFGAAMLLAGEWLNRRKPNIFSLGITAGGVSALYVAAAASYFGLKILGMYPALAVCVLITAAAFFLSRHYHSQTILSFALIGGYLPMFSVGAGNEVLYGAMVYFVLLNLLALMVAFENKWYIGAYIGLVLNILGTAFICLVFWLGNDAGSLSVASEMLLEKGIVIAYALFAFLVYTCIPLVSAYRAKGTFQAPDIILLAANTCFSCLIMYGVFYLFGFGDFDGLLALAFAVIYLLLGRLVEQRFVGGGRGAGALFYLTGLAFVVLVVPLQFGVAWLALGWLAEGVAITVYAILNDETALKRIGLAISGLCLLAFIMVDCLLEFNHLFAYKYLAMTLGSLLILGAYIRKKMVAGVFEMVYKYLTLINVWFYVLYVNDEMMGALLRGYPGERALNITYLSLALAVTLTFVYAYGLLRVRAIADQGTGILSGFLYGIGILGLFVLNATASPISHPAPVPMGVTLAGTLALLFLGLLSVLALRDLMKLVVTGRKVGIEWYPLVISGYAVLILTQNLTMQYQLAFSSAVISMIYVLAALAWIVYGFRARYSLIRRFGLGLAILAVIKLFLVDLYGLTQMYRILSYFTLGITLVAISFVYQYFSKRLELKKEVLADGEERDSDGLG